MTLEVKKSKVYRRALPSPKSQDKKDMLPSWRASQFDITKNYNMCVTYNTIQF